MSLLVPGIKWAVSSYVSVVNLSLIFVKINEQYIYIYWSCPESRSVSLREVLASICILSFRKCYFGGGEAPTATCFEMLNKNMNNLKNWIFYDIWTLGEAYIYIYQSLFPLRGDTYGCFFRNVVVNMNNFVDEVVDPEELLTYEQYLNHHNSYKIHNAPWCFCMKICLQIYASGKTPFLQQINTYDTSIADESCSRCAAAGRGPCVSFLRALSTFKLSSVT